MATHGFNAADMEARRILLHEELAALEADRMKAVGGMQVIDIHHPERSPGWPIYRHQAWPQLLYHSTQKDPLVEERRLGIRRRNESNPHLAVMDIPDPEPRTRKVSNEAELAEAIEQGFVTKPPERQMVDASSPLELIGRTPANPLVPAALPAQGGAEAAPAVDVDYLLKLARMTKEELLAFPANAAAPADATKDELIKAIIAA